MATIVNVQDPVSLNNLSIDASGRIGINNWPATQTISGTVSISAFPAVQQISGTVDVTDRALRQLGIVTISSGGVGTNTAPGFTVVQDGTTNANKLKVNSDGSINANLNTETIVIGTVELVDSGGANKATITGTGAVKVDGSAVTQPVSAASLPLPAGAALDATMTGGNAKSRPQVAGADVSPANPLPVDEAALQGPVNITTAGGATGGTSPTFTGTCTANQDNSVTFASKVRTIMMHNQSAVNVPYEHDIAAVATSAYLVPGQLVYIHVHTTSIHVFPSTALPINAASGLTVRGWN